MICASCNLPKARVRVYDRIFPAGGAVFVCEECWPMRYVNLPRITMPLTKTMPPPLKVPESMNWSTPKRKKSGRKQRRRGRGPKAGSRKLDDARFRTPWEKGQIKKIESLVDGVWVDTTKESEKFTIAKSPVD